MNSVFNSREARYFERSQEPGRIGGSGRKPRAVGTVLLRVNGEKTPSGRSSHTNGRSYESAHNLPPSQLVHGAVGEGVTRTRHSNEGIMTPLCLQLTERTASIHTVGMGHTQLVFILPVRCRGRSGQVGGGKGDERERWEAKGTGKGTDYLEELSGLVYNSVHLTHVKCNVGPPCSIREDCHHPEQATPLARPPPCSEACISTKHISAAQRMLACLLSGNPSMIGLIRKLHHVPHSE